MICTKATANLRMENLHTHIAVSKHPVIPLRLENANFRTLDDAEGRFVRSIKVEAEPLRKMHDLRATNNTTNAEIDMVIPIFRILTPFPRHGKLFLPLLPFLLSQSHQGRQKRNTVSPISSLKSAQLTDIKPNNLASLSTSSSNPPNPSSRELRTSVPRVMLSTRASDMRGALRFVVTWRRILVEGWSCVSVT